MSSPPDFHRFSDLAPELRIAVWNHAIAAHVRDALQNLPPHLRRDPNDKTRFWDDEHQDLVDCFPILAACREARGLALDYFQHLAGPRRRLLYFPRHLWFLDRWQDGAIPIQMSLGHDGDAAPSPQRPWTTLYISKGRFASPEQLVDVAVRYFGTAIERVVFEFVIGSANDTALNPCAYWPNPKCAAGLDVTALSTPSLIIGNHRCIISPKISRLGPPEAVEVMSISRDREIRRSTRKEGSHRCDKLALHLLILMDLFDAAREKLPHLKRFEVHCKRVTPPLDRETPFDPDRDIEWTRVEGVLKGDVQLFGWFTEFHDYFLGA